MYAYNMGRGTFDYGDQHLLAGGLYVDPPCTHASTRMLVGLAILIVSNQTHPPAIGIAGDKARGGGGCYAVSTAAAVIDEKETIPQRVEGDHTLYMCAT